MAGILASRTRRVNLNGNQGGGPKLQGLSPKATMFFISSGRGGWGHFLRETFAPRRDWIFCMNQLSGVGAGRSMFKIRGLNHPDAARRCKPHPFRKHRGSLEEERMARDIAFIIEAVRMMMIASSAETVVTGGTRTSENYLEWVFREQDNTRIVDTTRVIKALAGLVRPLNAGLANKLDAARLPGQFTHGGTAPCCECMDTWRYPSQYQGGVQITHYGFATTYDDPVRPWCYVKNNACLNASSGTPAISNTGGENAGRGYVYKDQMDGCASISGIWDGTVPVGSLLWGPISSRPALSSQLSKAISAMLRTTFSPEEVRHLRKTLYSIEFITILIAHTVASITGQDGLAGGRNTLVEADILPMLDFAAMNRIDLGTLAANMDQFGIGPSDAALVGAALSRVILGEWLNDDGVYTPPGQEGLDAGSD